MPLGLALGWGYWSLFKFTFRLTLTCTSMFLLEVRTWVPSRLGSWNSACTYPDLSFKPSSSPWIMPWLGTRGQCLGLHLSVHWYLHLHSSWKSFYARNWNLVYYLPRPKPSTLNCPNVILCGGARVQCLSFILHATYPDLNFQIFTNVGKC